MTKVDLITGFLGAGKTTFLLHYARYLMKKGQRIGILVYDHGAVNVDIPLLQELRGPMCELETIAGGCDADCHKRRFRTKLIAMGMSGYDKVLIEPSGVFDMDEFFDTLSDPPLDEWYEIGNVIAIVNAKLSDHMTEEADFFLASQACSAGCIVLSRAQTASEKEIQRTVRYLEDAAAKIRGSENLGGRILAKDWETLTEEEYERIASCGYHASDYVKTIGRDTSGFESMSFLSLALDREQMTEKVREMFQRKDLGNVFRIKGFFREGSRWYQVNATESDLLIDPISDAQDALIVIGSGLDEKAIGLLFTGKIPEYTTR